MEAVMSVAVLDSGFVRFRDAENQDTDLRAYARQVAVARGLDPELFIKQINQESGFQNHPIREIPYNGGVLHVGGIAQIVPEYHKVDVMDPYASLEYAGDLMAKHLQSTGGNYALALAAYNGGWAAVKAIQSGAPYKETQKYIQNIMGQPWDEAVGAPAYDIAPGDTRPANEVAGAPTPEPGQRQFDSQYRPASAVYGDGRSYDEIADTGRTAAGPPYNGKFPVPSGPSSGGETQGGGMAGPKTYVDENGFVFQLIPGEFGLPDEWKLVGRAGAGKSVEDRALDKRQQDWLEARDKWDRDFKIAADARDYAAQQELLAQRNELDREGLLLKRQTEEAQSKRSDVSTALNANQQSFNQTMARRKEAMDLSQNPESIWEYLWFSGGGTPPPGSRQADALGRIGEPANFDAWMKDRGTSAANLPGYNAGTSPSLGGGAPSAGKSAGPPAAGVPIQNSPMQAPITAITPGPAPVNAPAPAPSGVPIQPATDPRPANEQIGAPQPNWPSTDPESRAPLDMSGQEPPTPGAGGVGQESPEPAFPRIIAPGAGNRPAVPILPGTPGVTVNKVHGDAGNTRILPTDRSFDLNSGSVAGQALPNETGPTGGGRYRPTPQVRPRGYDRSIGLVPGATRLPDAGQPLTHNGGIPTLVGLGALPPALAAATTRLGPTNQTNAGRFSIRPQGGVPIQSAQTANAMSPIQAAAYAGTLKVTGNQPADFAAETRRRSSAYA